ATFDHVARRLDVERLVGVPDGVGAEVDEVHGQQKHDEQHEDPPRTSHFVLRTSHHQCRKCRRPVITIAMSCSSAAAMTSASRTDPPGCTTAVAPAAARLSRPSRNGKKASDAATVPRSRWPAFMTAVFT